jgi:hypothetical protein
MGAGKDTQNLPDCGCRDIKPVGQRLRREDEKVGGRIAQTSANRSAVVVVVVQAS